MSHNTRPSIAVVTPGGDAPGMNACIRAVVREALVHGCSVYGVHRGYQGLIEGEIRPLDRHSVSGIINRGGTILKSTRCTRIRTAEGMRAAAAQLRRAGISHLVVIGGDGSLAAGYRLSRRGFTVIGIPASIDNDVYGTDETIGFDTACDTAVEAIDKIRDTATSFDRIFVVEVMGREHGFIALNVGVASGAEFIILPERPLPVAEVCAGLRSMRTLGKSSVIIVFAEGAGDVRAFAQAVEEGTGVPTRVSSLGYIQRGGAPSARSRVLAAQFGAHAVRLILRGARSRLVVLRRGAVTDAPFKSSVNRDRLLDVRIQKLAAELTR
jgi:6-phosphofructokinase 1